MPQTLLSQDYPLRCRGASCREVVILRRLPADSCLAVVNVAVPPARRCSWHAPDVNASRGRPHNETIANCTCGKELEENTETCRAEMQVRSDPYHNLAQSVLQVSASCVCQAQTLGGNKCSAAFLRRLPESQLPIPGAPNSPK